MTKVVLKTSSLNATFHMKKVNLYNRYWSNSDAFWENKGKIYNGVCVKEVFFRSWHIATSLRMNFFTNNFQEFWLNKLLPLVTTRSFTKYLKSTSQQTFVLMKIYCEEVFRLRLQKTSWSKQIFLSWPYSSRRLQGIFKTSCKDVFKTFSRRIIRLNYLPRSKICLRHTSEKFSVSVENLHMG